MKLIPDTRPIELINQLATRICPVVVEDGKLWCVESGDVWNQSYLWTPVFISPAPALIVLQDITTYHTFGTPAFFKPSVSEVLRQIPDELLEQVDAFEIIRYPGNATDLNEYPDELSAGYHVATTRLYQLKERQSS